MGSKCLFDMRVKRVPAGVQVWMKSKTVADLMKSSSDRTEHVPDDQEVIGGKAFYVLRDGVQFRDPSGGIQPRFLDWDVPISNAGFNAQYLTLVELGSPEGITLVFPVPMSTTIMNTMLQTAYGVSRTIIREFAGPFDGRVLITTQEIEGEVTLGTPNPAAPVASDAPVASEE